MDDRLLHLFELQQLRIKPRMVREFSIRSKLVSGSPSAQGGDSAELQQLAKGHVLNGSFPSRLQTAGSVINLHVASSAQQTPRVTRLSPTYTHSRGISSFVVRSLVDG